MPREEREQRDEALRFEQERRGRFAGQFLDAGDDRGVVLAEGKGLLLGQRIERPASVAPSGLEHEHHFPARGRFDEVGRQKDEQLRRLAAGIESDAARRAGVLSMNRSAELPLGSAQASDRAEPELGAPTRFRGALRSGALRLHPVQADGNGVRANRSPLARVAARAEVFDVDGAVNDKPRAEGRLACLHHAPEQRRLPVGTEHLVLLDVAARPLHGLPAGGFLEQGV